MNDLISRQEAIDAVEESRRLNHHTDRKAACDHENEHRHFLNILNGLPPVDKWIPCSERMPECEQEVLICTKKKVYVSKKTGMEWYEESIVTPAIYEDGTMLEVNSKWHWEDIDYAGWDEEEDCGIISEGWWENRHFNPDEIYNNVVDREVIAWMPLPEPYKEDDHEID